MPPLEPFEAARIRSLLRDLQQTTRATHYNGAFRLERVKDDTTGIIISGLANRIAFIRLCLLLADRALDDEFVTLLDDADFDRVDFDSSGKNLEVIEIYLTDDPLLDPNPTKPNSRLSVLWGKLLVCCFAFGIVWIFVTGLVANLWLLWEVVSALWEIASLSFPRR